MCENRITNDKKCYFSVKTPLEIYPPRVYNAGVHEKASKMSYGNIHENDYEILLIKYVKRMPNCV